jgi:hypothetical protein
MGPSDVKPSTREHHLALVDDGGLAMSQIMGSTPLRTGHGWGQLVRSGNSAGQHREGIRRESERFLSYPSPSSTSSGCGTDDSRSRAARSMTFSSSFLLSSTLVWGIPGDPTELGKLPVNRDIKVAGLWVGVSVDLPRDAGQLAAVFRAPSPNRIVCRTDL